MADGTLVVVPPKSTRTRESSADQEIVERMASEVKPGVFVTDGTTYKGYQPTTNASATYRRALAAKLGVPVYKIKARTWGTDTKGNLLDDRKAAGAWQFALTHDPERTEHKRRQNGGSAS